MLTFPGR